MTENDSASAQNDHGRRKSLHLDMENQLIEMVIYDGLSTTKTKTAMCIDVTHSGASIQSDEKISIDTLLKLKLQPQDKDCPVLVATNFQQAGSMSVSAF